MFVAKGREADLTADPPAGLKGGDFERPRVNGSPNGRSGRDRAATFTDRETGTAAASRYGWRSSARLIPETATRA